MSAASKPHGTNNSHNTESDMDETITLTVMALAKGVGVLAWWSVLFPMISIPAIASVWVGFRDGPVFGVILAAVSGLALVAWSQLSPVTFHDWVIARLRSRWRTWSIYRHRWTAICTLHGSPRSWMTGPSCQPCAQSLSAPPATSSWCEF